MQYRLLVMVLAEYSSSYSLYNVGNKQKVVVLWVNSKHADHRWQNRYSQSTSWWHEQFTSSVATTRMETTHGPTSSMATAMGANVRQQRWWKCFHLSLPFVHRWLQWWEYICRTSNNDKRQTDFSEALPEGDGQQQKLEKYNSLVAVLETFERECFQCPCIQQPSFLLNAWCAGPVYTVTPCVSLSGQPTLCRECRGGLVCTTNRASIWFSLST